MKLILKQYLASLKERSELDVVLPQLLSQMGLNVYARPIRGAVEYGVDVAAVGKIDDVEKVYLFSVKSGNLTRSTWNGSSDQALRPSLESIIDSYIPTRLPPEHKDKPIAICMCFGGDIQTTVRQEVTGFTNNNSTDNLSFEEWNGDKLSDLILEHLLKEELLPNDWKSMLRKSLALLDEPRASHTHFKRLIQAIIKHTDDKEELTVKVLNRINLCLWILYAWCREGNNLESAYISAEYCVLNAWDIAKRYDSKKVITTYNSLLETYQVITDEFLNKCLIPFADKQHAISHAISSPCSVDVNLKLFDFLGRLAIRGQWLLFNLREIYQNPSDYDEENNESEAIEARLQTIVETIKQLVKNNPLLLSPYADDQAIDLILALHLLSQDSENDVFVVSWIGAIVDRITFAYDINGMYPTTLSSYEQLLEHKDKDKKDEAYKLKVTNASVLYPVLAIFSALHDSSLEKSKSICVFSEKNLAHSTLQYWYPNESSEEYFYTNAHNHGAASTDFELDAEKTISLVLDECKNSDFFWQLSAVRRGYSPLIMLACRHYRYPMPFHFLSDVLSHRLDTK